MKITTNCYIVLILIFFLTDLNNQSKVIAQTREENFELIKELKKEQEVLKKKVAWYYLGDIDREIKDNKKKIDQYRSNADNRFLGVRSVQDSLLEKLYSVSKNIQALEEKNQKQINSIGNQVNNYEDRFRNVEAKTGTGATDFISRFWILIAAALVFLMQAGFKVFEFGLVRKVHGDGIGMKNLIDWLVVCVVFYAFGFGFMFGESSSSLFNIIGGTLYFPSSDEMIPNFSYINDGETIEYGPYGLEFFLFQLTFAGTAATIVSGAMSERTAFIPYIITSLFVALIVYPIFGHWVWGNAYITTNTPWLSSENGLGFQDFAGSTVVHSIGAWVALVGIWKLKPRIGRFRPDGSVNYEDFKSSNLGYSVLGLFLLWFGWWGFNGGSALKLFSKEENIDVASIILNTNIAAAFAGLTAFAHSYITDKRNVYVKLMGGVLGGLVAITACCNIVSSETSMVIGIMAGFVHNLSFDLLLKLKLDDPVGAIPVHGFCGALGTLCVCLGDQYLFTEEMFSCFCKQLVGVMIAFVFASALAYGFFTLLKKVSGIRVSPRNEKFGYIVGEED